MARQERAPKKSSPVKMLLNLVALAAIVAIGVFVYRTWMETYAPTPDNPSITGDVADDDVRQLRQLILRISKDPILRIRGLSPTLIEVDTGVMKSPFEGGGHTWPGAFPVERLGYTTDSISASELIWEHFEANSAG